MPSAARPRSTSLPSSRPAGRGRLSGRRRRRSRCKRQRLSPARRERSRPVQPGQGRRRWKAGRRRWWFIWTAPFQRPYGGAARGFTHILRGCDERIPARRRHRGARVPARLQCCTAARAQSSSIPVEFPLRISLDHRRLEDHKGRPVPGRRRYGVVADCASSTTRTWRGIWRRSCRPRLQRDHRQPHRAQFATTRRRPGLACSPSSRRETSGAPTRSKLRPRPPRHRAGGRARDSRVAVSRLSRLGWRR